MAEYPLLRFSGTTSLINSLPRVEIGEIAYATDTDTLYIYTENGWTQMTEGVLSNLKGVDMNLYDMNKQIISQISPIQDFTDKINLINEYGINMRNKYYMLYGKEISYFTLFELIEPYYFGQEVIDCLQNVGTIKAIDLTEEGHAIEIWVETEDGPTCLYLFAYDSGVVQVGE